jgi:hypothetical protein
MNAPARALTRIVFEQTLRSGGIVRAHVEGDGDLAPSLRLERGPPPNTTRPPLSVTIAAAFAEDFARAVASWLAEVQDARARAASLPALSSRQNVPPTRPGPAQRQHEADARLDAERARRGGSR